MIHKGNKRQFVGSPAVRKHWRPWTLTEFWFALFGLNYRNISRKRYFGVLHKVRKLPRHLVKESCQLSTLDMLSTNRRQCLLVLFYHNLQQKRVIHNQMIHRTINHASLIFTTLQCGNDSHVCRFCDNILWALHPNPGTQPVDGAFTERQTKTVQWLSFTVSQLASSANFIIWLLEQTNQ